MRKRHAKRTQLRAYTEAIVSPFVASLAAFGVVQVLPHGNLLLVYLTAVLVVAVRTHVKPALLSALMSFLFYNFFFIEPRFTLFIMHREDILTASFFLLMATLAGQLAARLREQLTALREREITSITQMRLSQRLTTAIDKNSIVAALCAAVDEALQLSCFVCELRQQALRVLAGSVDIQELNVKLIQNAIENETPVNDTHPNYHLAVLYRNHDHAMILGLHIMENELQAGQHALLQAMLQQASLALGRTQLVSDLQCERVDKERQMLRAALLASVSHDLRTPLAAMIGATSSLLELDNALDGLQKKELLEAVLQEANRLDRYIQNLLDMTQVGRGELSLERDWIGLNEILNVVQKRIRPLLRGQRIHSELAAELPAVYVHAALIEQALFNVLDNAVKYALGNTTIRICAKRLDAKVQIDIIDQGPGIPVDQRALVFDMFYTIKRGDQYANGSGLGLAICQGVIHAHGGTIQALPGDNQCGCTIRMTLPIQPAINDRAL